LSILYIDESGTDSLKKRTDPENGNSNFFVMAGVLIESTELENAFELYEKVKRKYFKNTIFELKSSLKKLNFKDDFNVSNSELKLMVKDDVYNVICNANCFTFGVQLNKVSLLENGKIKSKNEIYSLAFEQLLLAVQNFKKTTHYEQPIIVMLDSREKKHNERMYTLYRKAIENHRTNLKGFDGNEFSPTLNFVDSTFTFGVQLADFVAGALWRGVEQNDKTYSKRLKEKFPTTDSGKFIGYSYIVCK